MTVLTSPQRTRNRNDAADSVVRSMVTAFLEDGGEEDALRASIAGELVDAGLPSQVARLMGMMRGWSDTKIDEIADMLGLSLFEAVFSKADVKRFLGESACAWARTMLRYQALTHARSEERALHRLGSLRPPQELFSEPSHRPGVPSRPLGATPDADFEDYTEVQSLADAVRSARRACTKDNLPHLMEFFLRRHYRISFPDRSQDMPAELHQAGFSAREFLSPDRYGVPEKVADAIRTAASLPRCMPAPAVVRAFIRLAGGLVPDSVAEYLVKVWLGQWADVTVSKRAKSPSDRELDAKCWSVAAEEVIGAGLVPDAGSVEELYNSMEALFWAAHSVVGEEKRSRAARHTP